MALMWDLSVCEQAIVASLQNNLLLRDLRRHNFSPLALPPDLIVHPRRLCPVGRRAKRGISEIETLMLCVRACGTSRVLKCLD